MVLLVGDDRLGPPVAACDDDLGGQEVVRCHPVAAGEQAEATAERGPDESDRALCAGGHRETRRAQRCHGLQLSEPGTDGRGAARRVDRHRLQFADVDDDAVVDGAPAFQSVTSAAGTNRHVLFTRPYQGIDDICCVPREHDCSGTTREESVPPGARFDVVAVAGSDHAPRQRRRVSRRHATSRHATSVLCKTRPRRRRNHRPRPNARHCFARAFPETDVAKCTHV